MATADTSSSAPSHNRDSKPALRPITPVASAAIGAVAGVTEVLIQQPTVAFKNALQAGRALPSNPLDWYRGVTINAASIAPITATQFAVNNTLISTLHPDTTAPLSTSAKLLYGSIAGMTSGLISGPAELLLIQQQISGRSLVAEFQHVLQQGGVRLLYRGCGSSILRDGVFTCGYMGLAPAISQLVQQYVKLDNPTVQNVMGSLAGGVVVGIISHPIDTVKTLIQSHLPVGGKTVPYKNLVQTTSLMLQQHGIQSLFRGLVPRTVRICGATLIIPLVGEKLTAVYQKG